MKKRNCLAFNKKGNAIADSIMIVVVIFVFAVIAFVGLKIFGDLNTEIQADDQLDNQSKQISEDLYDRYPSVMDGTFIFAFALIWILVLVASFIIDAHPIFFIVTLILLIFVIIIGAYIGNIYEELSNDSEIGTFASSFPMTNFVMQHYMLFIIAIALTVSLVLFGKNKFAGT